VSGMGSAETLVMRPSLPSRTWGWCFAMVASRLVTHIHHRRLGRNSKERQRSLPINRSIPPAGDCYQCKTFIQGYLLLELVPSLVIRQELIGVRRTEIMMCVLCFIYQFEQHKRQQTEEVALPDIQKQAEEQADTNPTPNSSLYRD